jgi:class 3 adenylate cyclase
MDAPPTGAREELLGGTVTLFFTDVEGSTELLGEIGAERYSAVLDQHWDIVGRALADSGGQTVDSRGEEFFAAFARARDSIDAAIAIEREHATSSWPEGAAPRVRIGIHTGEPVVRGQSYLGLDVHRAARISAAAHGGQVLLSQTTCALLTDSLPDGVTTADLGEHRLKGLGRPERIFQLVAPGLPAEFPPLRLEPAEAGRFAGEEEVLADALGDISRSSEPPRGRGWRLPGRSRARTSYRDLAWQVRALIPEASTDAQLTLAELTAELFNAARTTSDADRLLADVDHKRLDRQLRHYREMAVVSQRAGREVERVAQRIDSIHAVEGARNALDEPANEIAQILAGRTTPPKEMVEVLRRALAELEARLEDARGRLDRSALKLQRTRHRGIYRSGSRFVVPRADELGIEELDEFETLQEARDHLRSLELESRPSTAMGGGAPHDLGDAYQGYTPKDRGDRR